MQTLAALYTDDTVIDLGPTVQFHGTAGARQLVLDERHQAIVGRCAHTMGPFVIDIDGDHATATVYVHVYVSDPDTRNPGLWRIGYTELELVAPAQRGASPYAFRVRSAKRTARACSETACERDVMIALFGCGNSMVSLVTSTFLETATGIEPVSRVCRATARVYVMTLVRVVAG
jgi:SnoaL-like domain